MKPLPDSQKERVLKSDVLLIGEKFLKILKEKDTPYFSIVVKPTIEPRLKTKIQEPLRKVGPKEVQELMQQY